MVRFPSPKVTFALPVYNGEDLVGRAIESVLSQTVTDIELVVSDNCSTDSTEDICESYARRDLRLVYDRTEYNLGAAANFSRLPELARGVFFKWISHDDWVTPDFAEKCVPLLEADRDVMTVAPILGVVDRQGTLVQSVTSYIGRSGWSTNRLDQYREMMTELAYCETHDDGLFMCAYVYGLHRLSLLRKTRCILPFISSDYVLSAELALAGRLVELDELLSYFTISTAATGTSANFSSWNPSAIQRMLAPARVNDLDLAVSVRQRHFEHVNAVWRSSLAGADKVSALGAATLPMRARFGRRVRKYGFAPRLRGTDRGRFA